MDDQHRDTDFPDTATTRAASSDVVLERFIAAWECGDEPRVADFVGAAVGPADNELAAELVRVDMHERASRGQVVCLDPYLSELPELRDTPLEVIALILDEYSIRTESGQPVSLEDYARRFPEHLDTLRRELDLTEEPGAPGCSTTPAEVPEALPPVKLSSQGNAAAAVESDWIANLPDTLAGPRSEADAAFCTRSESTQIGSIPATGQLIPGTRMGDFQIERLVGEGGLARVYKARQVSLDRIVALKVTASLDGESQPRDEGRNMAALVHDHIVPVFSQERTSGFDVLAMGFVAGPTLSELLDVLARVGRGKTSSHQCHELIQDLSDAAGHTGTSEETRPTSGRFVHFACRLIRDLARALAHAHRKGILHCDVKPANILFAPSGRAMLTDFNVSVRRDDESDGSVGGTLQYMSPEQLAAVTTAGSPDAVNEQSDVYSLGLVLFELLTGERPHTGAVISSNPLTMAGELLAVRLSSDLQFPTTDLKLSAALRSIVQTSLTPSLDNRYQTADELADDLDRLLASRALKYATDPDRVDRAIRWVNRHRASSVVLLSAVVLGLVVFLRNDERPIVFNVASAETHAPSGEDNRIALALDHQGRQCLEKGQFGQAVVFFEKALELNPELAAIHNNLGVTRFRLGRFADALASFDRTIELGRATGLVYSHRAAARFALGDLPGSRADFEKSVQVAAPSERDEVDANFREFEARLAATTAS
jgi:serine/threonine protein kinase